jgi:hypothetical protein
MADAHRSLASEGRQPLPIAELLARRGVRGVMSERIDLLAMSEAELDQLIAAVQKGRGPERGGALVYLMMHRDCR